MNYGETNSPLKDTGDIIGGAVQGAAAGATLGPYGALAGAVIGGIGGYFTGKAKDDIQEDIDEKQRAFQNKIDAFVNKEISNPFAGITNTFAGLENPLAQISTENKFEDLTVNLKSADYQRQMAEESQAAILQTARAGAGGAGAVASIAGLLARQNAQVRQQIAADIGSQEAQNQRLKAQGAEQARQAQMQIGRAQMDIDRLKAQGAMQAQIAGAEGQFRVDQAQREREALGLGFGAQQLAGDTSAGMAQIESGQQLLSQGLSAAGSVASAFGGFGGGSTSTPTQFADLSNLSINTSGLGQNLSLTQPSSGLSLTQPSPGLSLS